MVSWITKIFRRLKPSSRSGRSELDDVIVNRKKLLTKHIKIQTKKAKSHSQLVPRGFVGHCQRLFVDHLDDIAEKVVNSEVRGSPPNHCYKDTKSGVYMVITVLPWTTEEAVRKLAEMSTERPFGYGAMWLKYFINYWPSPELTHFFHVILCLGGDVFHLHTAMGDYGGFPKAPRDFTVLPVELLNADERRIFGL